MTDKRTHGGGSVIMGLQWLWWCPDCGVLRSRVIKATSQPGLAWHSGRCKVPMVRVVVNVCRAQETP